MWSYHFRWHPGSQIMDGLSKDAHGGEHKHNSEDYTCSATERQAESRMLAVGLDCTASDSVMLNLPHRCRPKEVGKRVVKLVSFSCI